MNVVQLLPVGTVERSLLEHLRHSLARCLPVTCEIVAAPLDAAAAYHPERQQFHSSEILQRMAGLGSAGAWRMLAVADVDLYIPILKYVFGEAQIGGPCAVVSAHRLRQDFYGLQPDEELLHSRLLKESVHEWAIPSTSATVRTTAVPWPPRTPWNGSICAKIRCVIAAARS
jgi:archaemetzincin